MADQVTLNTCVTVCVVCMMEWTWCVPASVHVSPPPVTVSVCTLTVESCRGGLSPSAEAVLSVCLPLCLITRQPASPASYRYIYRLRPYVCPLNTRT